MGLWAWPFGSRSLELVYVRLISRLDLGFGCCVFSGAGS